MAMETSGNTDTTVKCLRCGWGRPKLPGENAADAARYHRIQVHNDQEAARAWRF